MKAFWKTRPDNIPSRFKQLLESQGYYLMKGVVARKEFVGKYVTPKVDPVPAIDIVAGLLSTMCRSLWPLIAHSFGTNFLPPRMSSACTVSRITSSLRKLWSHVSNVIIVVTCFQLWRYHLCSCVRGEKPRNSQSLLFWRCWSQFYWRKQQIISDRTVITSNFFIADVGLCRRDSIGMVESVGTWAA